MTCIVGLVRDNKVYLGADSAAVDSPNDFVEQWKTPKTFKKDAFVFAFAGSYTVGQLVRFSLVLPDMKEMEIEAYLITKFAPALKKLLNREGIKEDSEWSILIGYKNRLFAIESEYNVGEPLEGYTAEGSGRDFAMGALSTIIDTPAGKNSPEFCITTALKAAEKYCSNVKGPFVYVNTD